MCVYLNVRRSITYNESLTKQSLYSNSETITIGKIYKRIISTSPFGTLASIASLWAATLYQENRDRKCKHGNILSIGRYIPRMQVLLECCYLEMESSQFLYNNRSVKFDSNERLETCTTTGEEMLGRASIKPCSIVLLQKGKCNL